MTDVRQFGDLGTRSLDCTRCEAMLADAGDGALSAEEQQFFDAHIIECGPCEQLLAEAKRGAAWLEMLRTPAPEPPPALLEKILAQTAASPHAVPFAQPVPAMAPGYGNVLPFPRRAAAAMRASGFARLLFEPRLAMTAAMAFLSIALTMDLMGVNPMALRARDLTPSGMHRAFAQLDARVVQYYEGLRVVYELESRVHDFQEVQGSSQDAAPAQQQAPASTNDQAQPAGDNPADQPDEQVQPENQDKTAPQSAPSQQPSQHKAAPGDGVSRREETRPMEFHGLQASFPRGNNSMPQPAVSTAAWADAVAAAYARSDAQGDMQPDDDALSGGTSSLVVMDPLHHHAGHFAQRRAA